MALWTSILSASRACDWSGVGVLGGIPTTRTKSGSTIAAYTGTAATINNALASAPEGTYVELGAGTFNLSTSISITRNNVTLRGQGMSTILNFTNVGGSSFYWGGGSVCIALQHASYSGNWGLVPGSGGVPASTIKTWSGTGGQSGVYSQGATVINLASAPTGLAVGNSLSLWQLDPADNQVPTAGWFTSDKCFTGSGDVSWKGTSDYMDTGMTHRGRVTNISGNNVTITPGLIHATGCFATALGPKVGWVAGTLVGVGLENFRITHVNDVNTIVGMNACDSCWASGIALVGVVGKVPNVTWLSDSHNLTWRNCWLGPARGGGAGNYTSYGWRTLNVHASLFENCILAGIESPVIIDCSATGNVFAYNYEHQLTETTADAIQTHGAGPAQNLVEGNSFRKYFAEIIHGPTNTTTVYRNYFKGPYTGCDIWAYCRWHNLVGNVVASAGPYKSLYTDGTKYTRWDGVAFRLGYASQYAEAMNVDPDDVSTSRAGNDAACVPSTMLWGNYAVTGNSVRWEASENGSGDATFPALANPSQTLPASFYRSSRPGFFTFNGSVQQWPPIGPDVSGGSYLGGRAYKIPAQLAYELAGGSVASFNPTLFGTDDGTSQPPTGTPVLSVR